jgi:hypothetical protein
MRDLPIASACEAERVPSVRRLSKSDIYLNKIMEWKPEAATAVALPTLFRICDGLQILKYTKG